MAEFFSPAHLPPDLPGGRDGHDKQELDLVFDLGAQLRAAGETPPPNGVTA